MCAWFVEAALACNRGWLLLQSDHWRLAYGSGSSCCVAQGLMGECWILEHHFKENTNETEGRPTFKASLGRGMGCQRMPTPTAPSLRVPRLLPLDRAVGLIENHRQVHTSEEQSERCSLFCNES